MDVIDLENKLSVQQLSFALSTDLWEKVDVGVINYIQSNAWQEIKFLEENGEYSAQVSEIPNEVGGIYLFYINPNIIKDNHKFLCYIGRAHKTSSMNLRTRVRCYKDYENAPKKLDRPKLRKLFCHWSKFIYCRYLPIPDNVTICNKRGNDLIDYIEAELINGLLPPCNTQIPNVTISNAKSRAFI